MAEEVPADFPVQHGDRREPWGGAGRARRRAAPDSPRGDRHTGEKNQPYGNRAREALSDLIYGKTVRVVEVVHDRYGRLVERVYAGGIDVNAEMVRLGAAWVYRKHAKDRSLYELENKAPDARRGLWLLPEAEREPPWQWREEQRDSHRFPARLDTASQDWS